MRAPSEKDLVELLTVEPLSPVQEPTPHMFHSLPAQPSWCAHCWHPREHRVHVQAVGERP